jgi:FAD/FMN-containing dehydrogenase
MVDRSVGDGDVMRDQLPEVNPGDPQYRDLQLRGKNRRFVGTPESVYLAADTREVVAAVDVVVSSGKKLAVRSGGHCIEGFIDDPAVECVIDLARLDSVYYDEARRAFAVEAGATFGRVYQALDLGWGVTLPGSTCPSVGVGGHVIGGGFGALSRLHGCISDHLYAVESVIVDANGKAKQIIATREESDPNRDLWWAHAGGGGGNFGVATKFWFRSRDAHGDDPALLLPRRPSGFTLSSVAWKWADLNEATFTTLLHNFMGWCGRNSSPNTPAAAVWGQLVAFRKEFGVVMLVGQIDPGQPAGREALDAYFAEVTANVPNGTRTTRDSEPWLYNAINLPDTSDALGLSATQLRSKAKGGYLRSPLDAAQSATVYERLTDEGYGWRGGVLTLATWGGKINALSPRDTAVVERESTVLLGLGSFWDEPHEDEKHLSWTRTFYRDLFATSGGVPVRNDRTGGCYVNWPDVDLLDQKWNESGSPWSDLYYGGNYTKLRETKSRWDPHRIFNHPLSIEPS